MADRMINTTEFVSDVRAGMTDAELRDKHGLSADQLKKLFEKLLAKGKLAPADLEDALPHFEPTIELAYTCPKCGAVKFVDSDRCPQCGDTASSARSPQERRGRKPVSEGLKTSRVPVAKREPAAKRPDKDAPVVVSQAPLENKKHRAQPSPEPKIEPVAQKPEAGPPGVREPVRGLPRKATPSPTEPEKAPTLPDDLIASNDGKVEREKPADLKAASPEEELEAALATLQGPLERSPQPRPPAKRPPKQESPAGATAGPAGAVAPEAVKKDDVQEEKQDIIPILPKSLPIRKRARQPRQGTSSLRPAILGAFLVLVAAAAVGVYIDLIPIPNPFQPAPPPSPPQARPMPTERAKREVREVRPVSELARTAAAQPVVEKRDPPAPQAPVETPPEPAGPPAPPEMTSTETPPESPAPAARPATPPPPPETPALAATPSERPAKTAPMSTESPGPVSEPTEPPVESRLVRVPPPPDEITELDKTQKAPERTVPAPTKQETPAPGGVVVDSQPTMVDKSEPAPDRILRAAKDGDVSLAKALLERGSDINAIDGDGLTALMHAAWQGNEAMVELLVKAGADASVKDRNGVTALSLACDAPNPRIINLLLEHDKAKGAAVLLEVCKKDSTEMVKMLVENGADVNARDEDGATPLMFLAAAGELELIKLLLQKGAQINARDNKGVTALGWAYSPPLVFSVPLRVRREAVRLLKSYGASSPRIATTQ